MKIYQENSQLLDPYLPGIIDPLASSLRSANPCVQNLISANRPEFEKAQQDDTNGLEKILSVGGDLEKRISCLGKFLWVVASVR